VIDPERRYHRALVSNPLNASGNAVTTAPARFNMLEARVGIPLQWATMWHRSKQRCAGKTINRGPITVRWLHLKLH